MAPRVTKALAERHEALFVHLEALLKSVALVAAKRPQAEIGEALRIEAEALLFDCVPFLARPSRKKFPVAAPDHAGLLVQLGQAMAGLVAYEQRWAGWDQQKACFCWMTAKASLPVRRLRPQLAMSGHPAEDPESERIRAALARRIKNHAQGEYERGYGKGLITGRAEAAGIAGTAPKPAGPRRAPL